MTANHITLTMSEKTITVETMTVETATRSSEPVTEIFNLDGSESKNGQPVGVNRNGKTPPAAVSTARWEGAALVVTTTADGVLTERRRYSMDGANLKIEYLLLPANGGSYRPDARTVTAAATWTLTVIYRRAEEFGAGAYYPGADIENPALLRNVPPEYTDAAKRAKIQGEVELEAVIQPNGCAGDIRVIRSLDRAFGLDEKAIEAVRQWVFKPGTRAIVRLILEFRLH